MSWNTLLENKIDVTESENIKSLFVFLKKEIINHFIENYSEEIINITLNKQNRVKRWQWMEWIKLDKEQSNKHHIFSMFYYYVYLTNTSLWLNEIIDDLWELYTWDITTDKKENMSKNQFYELEKKWRKMNNKRNFKTLKKWVKNKK